MHRFIFVKYKQQDTTFHNLFIPVRRSTCFNGFSVHHQELKTVHIVSCICQTNAGIALSESDGTTRRTGGEVKGKDANGVGSQ